MALVNCPECSHQISDKAENCPSCGIKVPKYRECAECFEKVSVESEMCQSCGNPMQVKHFNGFGVQKRLSVVIAVMVLVIISILIVNIMKSESVDSNASTANSVDTVLTDTTKNIDATEDSVVPKEKVVVKKVSDDDIIDNALENEAKNQDASFYADGKMTINGDLNGDGLSDVAVLYTLEGAAGGNNYTQFLGVFLRTKSGLSSSPISEVVGGKVIGSAELMPQIKGSVISIKTLTLGEDDPFCCPSVEGFAQYKLVGGVLTAI